jgi:hypothetical protein
MTISVQKMQPGLFSPYKVTDVPETLATFLNGLYGSDAVRKLPTEDKPWYEVSSAMAQALSTYDHTGIDVFQFDADAPAPPNPVIR